MGLWSQTRLNRRQERLWQRLQGGWETGLQQQSTQRCMVGDMVAAEEEEGNRKYRGQCRCVKGQKSELQTWYAKSHLPLGRAAMNKPVHYGQLLTQLQARRVSCLHTMLRPSCPMSQERAAAVWTKWSTEWINEQDPSQGPWQSSWGGELFSVFARKD